MKEGGGRGKTEIRGLGILANKVCPLTAEKKNQVEVVIKLWGNRMGGLRTEKIPRR